MKRHLFAAAAAFALSGCAMMGGGDWVTLIDGDKGLDNFTRDGDANWRAEGGAIVADRGKGGFLVSKQSFGDYQLRIEFFPDHNTNSGIYMRCSVREKLTDKLCHEANVFDQRPDPTFATGGIVHMGKVLQPVKAGGKWNTYDITARGKNITVVLNGVKTAEIDNAQFLNGPIALQFGNLPNNVPGGAIRFRKVQVRPL
ncbi:MAG: 3-keto-disaccharide hydrolase [Burkholderiales bacterium]